MTLSSFWSSTVFTAVCKDLIGPLLLILRTKMHDIDVTRSYGRNDGERSVHDSHSSIISGATTNMDRLSSPCGLLAVCTPCALQVMDQPFNC